VDIDFGDRCKLSLVADGRRGRIKTSSKEAQTDFSLTKKKSERVYVS
jgi:hypothetical protein